MPREAITLQEHLIALHTFVRFLSYVSSHVIRETITLQKCFITYLTCMRFDCTTHKDRKRNRHLYFTRNLFDDQ